MARPTQSYARLSLAIIIAGIVVAAAIVASISLTTKASPVISTSTVVSTSVKTLVQTVTSNTTESCTDDSSLHCVVFQQLGACSPEFWGIPWSVTIGNMTEVQPPGTPLPLNNYGLDGTLNSNLTVIVFSLPNGHYNFSVSPSAAFFTPTTGSVSVSGSDVLVQIAYTGTSCIATLTSSSANASGDTFLTSCSVTGIGGLEIRILSDSTGAPVSGENITAVDTLGCDIVGQPAETQVAYLDSFSSGTGGWLTPIFPSQAEPGGQLAFTVAYQGTAYRFTENVPPIGSLCVTLHVPSGNITSTTVMNGSGSYCS